jgi:hypothetical protein
MVFKTKVATMDNKWPDSICTLKVGLTGFAFLMMTVGLHCSVWISHQQYNFLVSRVYLLHVPKDLSNFGPRILQMRYFIWKTFLIIYSKTTKQYPETNQCLANMISETLSPTVWQNTVWTIPTLCLLQKSYVTLLFNKTLSNFLFHKLYATCSFGLNTQKQNPKEKDVIWRIQPNGAESESTLDYWLELH